MASFLLASPYSVAGGGVWGVWNILPRSQLGCPVGPTSHQGKAQCSPCWALGNVWRDAGLASTGDPTCPVPPAPPAPADSLTWMPGMVPSLNPAERTDRAADKSHRGCLCKRRFLQCLGPISGEEHPFLCCQSSHPLSPQGLIPLPLLPGPNATGQPPTPWRTAYWLPGGKPQQVVGPASPPSRTRSPLKGI